ncbi:MAG: ATP-binding protein [Sterolibacteriaceae bacterium MAG5]|nr:ATP-binding protein [Candidatus Nitricoxidireducens bremensis]
MFESLNSIHALTVLYDLSLTVGSEVELEPLLTKSLQRLLYHTGFPVGVVVTHEEKPQADGSINARLEMAIGDYGLIKQKGQVLHLPAALLLEDTPKLAEAPDQLAAFGTRKPQRYYLRLPVPGFGAIFLMGSQAPDTGLALQELFVPILARLGNAIDLCRRLEERTEQMETANRELEAFAYSVSHDLRAPLRAINGFSHILLETERDRMTAEGRDLFNRIARNVGKLERLIDDILQYSRAGRLPLAKTAVDMALLARSVGDELGDGYPGTAIRVGPLPPAHGDRNMLRQVFQNLIDNACKFSSKRPEAMVEIGAREENGATVYFVRDNGAGFDMHYADKLFGMFQRMHGETEFPGTGVGLAIVKRLVERHGGRIWAEAAPDRGATFSFTLGG